MTVLVAYAPLFVLTLLLLALVLSGDDITTGVAGITLISGSGVATVFAGVTGALCGFL
ncbi:hypothetical protein P167DRAFT_539410 [Morchella conica CCBAS932]|uniref:Uncharacterized protein n=1 Tax=Morchella conica CCBAS932 TaxID=1392247 RepID=A0A3N4KIQ2_9PEZI|nr:hypothetical protein P167DRAFT_539410 [Morchella conica CCBAS932]